MVSRLKIWFHDWLSMIPFFARQESYSQEGEDLILRRLCGDHFNKKFIDVGANHPILYNNTYWFYKHRGWTGMNVEPVYARQKFFDKVRPKDVFWSCAVGDVTQRVYLLSDVQTQQTRVVSREAGFPVLMVPLEFLLDKQPDTYLLNIDCEGGEFDCIKTVDWAIHSPKFIVIEDEEYQTKFLDSAIHTLLRAWYHLVGRTAMTSVYRRKDVHG